MTNYNFQNNKHLIILWWIIIGLGLLSSLCDAQPKKCDSCAVIVDIKWQNHLTKIDSLDIELAKLDKKLIDLRELLQLQKDFLIITHPNDTLLIKQTERLITKINIILNHSNK